MRCFILFLSCCCGLFLPQVFSYGHPDGKIHVREMYSVLPFEKDANGDAVPENKRISDWLGMITTDLIDNYWGKPIPEFDYRTFYDYLREEFGFSCKHRLLFHWGFNDQPWSEAIEKKVRYYEWANDSEKLTRFKQAFIIEQKRRNKQANKETESLFGFASGGQEASWANGILSIVYDVHLLGDYEEGDNSDFEGVTPPSKISGDIINSLRKIDPKLSRGLIEDIRRTTIMYKNEHKLAEEIIKLLQKQLPNIIFNAQSGKLRHKFEQQGFKTRRK